MTKEDKSMRGNLIRAKIENFVLETREVEIGKAIRTVEYAADEGSVSLEIC